MNLLKTIDLANKYGVTVQTIYLWMKKGLPYTTLPTGQHRFNEKDVESWVNNEDKAGD
jgi:predicted site-specific integrase-resolvase